MDWVCSGCGRHYSWMVTECPHCQPVVTITTGGTQPTSSNSASEESLQYLEMAKSAIRGKGYVTAIGYIDAAIANLLT